MISQLATFGQERSSIMENLYDLKLDDFDKNWAKTLESQRKEGKFCDVTLVCDDMVKIRAHRFVLSSRSEFFKSILDDDLTHHHYISLDGISSVQMNKILDFIYLGQAKVEQDSLDKFLIISARLKVNGTVSQDSNNQIEMKEEKESLLKQEKQQTVYKCNKSNDDSFALVPKVDSTEDLQQSSLNDFKNVTEQYLDTNDDGTFTCQLCGKIGKYKHVMMFHVETHINGIVYNCPYCDKTFKTRNSVKCHKSMYHRNAKLKVVT